MIFSVIIPTRDRAEKLRRALESVTAQTHQDYEIIVIDDGSLPSEAARIADLVADTPKASLIRNDTSLGAPRSRNAGVAASGGDTIALLDSDDWWAPTRLAAHRVAIQQAPDVSLTYNAARLVDSRGEVVGLANGAPPDPARTFAAATAGSNFLGGCSSVCVNRKSFEDAGGFAPDLPSCQDWDLWYRIARRGGLIRFLDEALTLQDWGSHQRISNQRDRVVSGHATVMDIIIHADWNEDDLKFILAQHDLVRAWVEHSFGNNAKALDYALKSLRRLPNVSPLKTAMKYATILLKSSLSFQARSVVPPANSS